jgi:hypothetical protein
MTKLNNIDSQGNDQFVMEFHVPLMKKINLNTWKPTILVVLKGVVHAHFIYTTTSTQAEIENILDTIYI